MRRRAANGAAWGVLAWLTYGVVELILSAGIQLWRFPEMRMPGWQWRLIAMLMAAYAAIGLVAGAIGGLVGAAAPEIFPSLTIALVFIVNLVSAWPLARSEYIGLAAAGILTCLLAATLLSERVRKKWRFLTSPWTVSVLLLGAPWVSREALDSRPSALVKTGLSLLFLTAVIGCAALWSRLRYRPSPAMLSQAVMAALAAGLFAGVVTMAGRPTAIRVDRPATPGAKKTSILLITMDTVRADHTSLYGYRRDTTPNLRDFAKTATLYSRAVSTSDFTLPTHASLFTGLYPNWSGALAPPNPDPHHIANPLRADKTTLAEIVRSQGYWTAESAANFGFLTPWTGLARGFAVSDFRRPVNFSTGDRPFYLRAVARRLLSLFVNTARFDRLSIDAWSINGRALDFIDRAKESGAPFFLFVNYMDAHTPYVPDPPFDTRYPGLDRNLAPHDIPSLEQSVDSGKHELTALEKRHLNSQYDGGIAEEDAAIGNLLEHLRQLGLYDDMLIVITADHGETLGEHGLLDHFLGFVYQELIHVPLAIKYPHQHDASRQDELVSQVDILPTILDLLAIKPSPELQGRSLLKPVPEGGATVYSQGTHDGLIAAGNPRFAGLRRAILSGSSKLIVWTAGPPELYDVASDPTEQHNLYRSDDLRSRDLSQRLASWVASMPRASTPHNLDKNSAERLKSLGYIQ